MPELEQRLGHRRTPDDRAAQAGEVGVGETGILRHEEVGRRNAHHRGHPLLADQRERPGRVERRLEHHAGALPPREQRLHVPPADVELRQELEDDVLVAETGDAVEGEVRPEAVRVGEHGALRASGRARGVDEQQPVVVARRRWWWERGLVFFAHKLLERRAPLRAARRPSPANSGEARSDRRLGIGELVGELGVRQPPVQREQDQARLRAREEDDDVLGTGAGERRHAVARHEPVVEQAGGEPLRPLVELAVGRLRAEEVDRDPLRGRPGAVADPAVEGEIAHRRNPSSSRTNRSGSCQKKRWPQPA